MQMFRMSSVDRGYSHGLLSTFPEKKDNKFNLYEVKNNAETRLKNTLSMSGKYIILEDASRFPNFGLAKITNKSEQEEIVFYGMKKANQLHFLQRGFSDTKHYIWPAGSKICCPVMAEHHNALKDAVIKIQQKIGLAKNPDPDSINGILTRLEKRWLAPKPIFRGFPLSGKAPLNVCFHNFSTGYGTRFLWEFGDGTTSSEKNPSHIYATEGNYTVKLNMMSSLGNQALAEKSDYIQVGQEKDIPFFYIDPTDGISKETADEQNVEPTKFTLIDQSDYVGVIERHWFFGDDKEVKIDNPNIHTVIHYYEKPGNYKPSLMINLESQKMLRPILMKEIAVI